MEDSRMPVLPANRPIATTATEITLFVLPATSAIIEAEESAITAKRIAYLAPLTLSAHLALQALICRQTAVVKHCLLTVFKLMFCR